MIIDHVEYEFWMIRNEDGEWLADRDWKDWSLKDFTTDSFRGMRYRCKASAISKMKDEETFYEGKLEAVKFRAIRELNCDGI